MSKSHPLDPPTTQSSPLDPGPPARRPRSFGCKSILWTFLVLGALGVCYFVSLIFRGIIKGLGNPHMRLYQDMERPYRPQDVVRPLVNENQTFDIVATVWLRTETESDWEAPEFDVWTSDQKQLVLHEKPIFAETVFKGLTLKDKKRKTSVNLQISTEIFKRLDLNNYDLRASFVLVPSSPSLLDSATEYSSWKPTSTMYTPPVRSWPHGYKPSIAEEIVDSFGNFIPLVSFQNIQSNCSTSQNGSDLDDEDEDDSIDGEIEGQQGSNAWVPTKISQHRAKWQSTNGKSVLSSHPYVITRSFLRVVDMTRVMNKKLYDESHNKIKSNSCGRYLTTQGSLTRPSWKDCIRDFILTGSQEVRIKLSTKSKKSGKERTEWAYAPYLEPSESSWGPLDLVPVPVNRENCRHSENINEMVSKGSTGEDQNFMNITWNIAFSGRSPMKLLSSILENKMPQYNMTDSETNIFNIQASSDLRQSFSGHPANDRFHARRYFILNIATLVLGFLETIYEMHYWYTCSSTVGISTSGMSLIAGTTFTGWILVAAENTLKNEATWKSFLFHLFSALMINVGYLATSLMIIKATARAEIHWSKRWIPIVRFTPPTHAERSSCRNDAAVTLRLKTIVFLCQAAVLYFLHSQQYFFISGRGPSNDITSKSLQIVRFAFNYAVVPVFNLGWMLQIILNHRMRTFAGAYKITAYMMLATRVIDLMIFSPWIIGENMIQDPVSYQKMFELFWCTALAVQAFIHPSVSWVEEEEDSR